MLRLFALSLVISLTATATAEYKIQSRFVGPVNLKVWKHWQPSWNVEDDTSNFRFALYRSASGEKGKVTLSLFNEKESDVTGQLECEAYKRTEQWKVEKKLGKTLTATGTRAPHGELEFAFEGADDCIDVAGKNLTQKILVRVVNNKGKGIFEYSVMPMYVRGKNHTYWNNEIPPYTAHGGSGKISVATMLAGEAGWDTWNGTVVKPELLFADRNTMKAGAVIGMHRHEANQEAYVIESGQAEMIMGIAQKHGEIRKTQKVWDGDGNKQDTDEFSAAGGWKEIRYLEPGEMAIIVPNKEHKDTVYFHGIRAATDLVFWTMGSRN